MKLRPAGGGADIGLPDDLVHVLLAGVFAGDALEAPVFLLAGYGGTVANAPLKKATKVT